MKLDNKLVTGIFVGVVIGLHYHVSLIAYLPILMIVTLVLLLKTVRR